ncbi:hypothetical protein [Rothia sp. ZJ1223]|nr:hypothetical protein [Rothia sp. ZJ1223]MBM7052075.1 hypothetical protein [Rothia sp. ZJ1223]
MAQKKQTDITDQEFRELMREIIRRFIYATLILAVFGVLVTVAMTWWQG